MGARQAWALAACFLGLGAVILASAMAMMVDRAQPTIVMAPYDVVLPVTDKAAPEMAIVTPESEVDDGRRVLSDRKSAV